MTDFEFECRYGGLTPKFTVDGGVYYFYKRGAPDIVGFVHSFKLMDGNIELFSNKKNKKIKK